MKLTHRAQGLVRKKPKLAMGKRVGAHNQSYPAVECVIATVGVHQ